MNVFLAVLVLVLLLAGIVSLSVLSMPQEQEDLEERIVFRLAETYPAVHPSAMAAQLFADLVDERTGGRIQIKVYYDGELGNESQVLEQMQFGGIALARVNLLELSDAVPVVQPYIEPYGYAYPEEMLELFYQKSDLISSTLQMEKFFPLVWYYPDMRCFYSKDTPIRVATDLRGMKLKTSDSHAMSKTMEEVGAQAVTILAGDEFKSLSAGYMDGGETALCNFMLSDIYSIVPYVAVSQYLYCPDVIIGSSAAFSNLSRDDQELLETCARETYDYHKALLLEMQRASLDTLEKDKGLDIHNNFLDETMRTWFQLRSGGGGADA